jgi:K(+)-stimulated pyrophosphate-energized sodium pump
MPRGGKHLLLLDIPGERVPMTVVYIALGCGLLAVLYGLLTIMQVLKAPAGNERMQDIAASVQEGARA